ncbi:MAG TPA: cytochrome c biogenesis protein CcsA [Chthoniobacterales bacterium]|nr:cytochrome c biogenesis protein CcsA [Chthoniobacterales bacterium]
MERYWLVAASFCFLLSFGHTLFALGSGTFRPARFNLAAMAGGFAFESVFLYQRGQIVQTCPITNLFEVLVFLSWSIVLIYLLVGPAYRLSLMGAFTSPLVLALLMLALFAPVDIVTPRGTHNPWIEFHAALSIIAYGAFGLACIAGIMYLVQERQLKSGKVSELLLNLPPITDLGAINGRLLFTGFLLLTVAFVAGLAAGIAVAGIKAGVSFAIWTLYGTLLAMDRMRLLPTRRIAGGSIAIFIIALVTLPSVSHLAAP